MSPLVSSVPSGPTSGHSSRRGSIATADDVRRDLAQSFQKADTDGSGFLDRYKLTELVKDLHIPLKDTAMDMDALVDFMDPSNTGKIGYKEFSDCFEPYIRYHEEHGLEMEIEDIIKDAITHVLSAVREQRNYINAGFLETSQMMEKEHQGFGVNFWGSCWRFKMYDDFYSAAKAKDGTLLPYSKRYDHLKKRLAAVAKGSDPWIMAVTACDAKIRNEIGNPKGVQHFCKEWLAFLEKEERVRAKPAAVKPAGDAQKDVSG